MSFWRLSGVFLLSLFAAIVCADEKPPFQITVAAPWGCKPGQCKLNLTVAQIKDTFWFSLDAEAKEYVAVALAETAMMGNDSVIECVRPATPTANKAIEVYYSTNQGPPATPGRGNTRVDVPNIENIVKNITGGSKDGRIFCTFILNSTPQFPKSKVDLIKSRYYLQVAAGDNLKGNRTGIAKHSRWATTLRPVSLVKDEGKLRSVDNEPCSASGSAPKLAAPGIVLTTVMISRYENSIPCYEPTF